MGIPRILAKRVEPKGITHAFDHRRLAGAPPAHKHVQVPVEVHGGVAQEPAFPCHRNKLGMGIGFRVAVQADTGDGVEKRLPERLDRDGGHLDEAGGCTVLQIVRVADVRRVQNGERTVSPMLGVLVLEDMPDPVWRGTDRSRQCTGKEVGTGPDIDSRLSRELFQQSAVRGDMGCYAHGAPVPGAFKQFGGILLAGR